MASFIVTGVLAGEYLPAQPLILNNVAVWYDPDSIEKMLQRVPEIPTIAGAAECVAIHPAVGVKSRWRVDFLLEANGGEEASQRTLNGHVPLFLAALGASTGERYAIELLQVVELQSSPITIAEAHGAVGHVENSWSKCAAARVIVTRRLLDEIALTVDSRLRILESDAVGTQAGTHFSFANELTDLAHVKDAVAMPALTQYFLCIERIVKAVAPTVGGLEATQKKQRQEVIVDN